MKAKWCFSIGIRRAQPRHQSDGSASLPWEDGFKSYCIASPSNSCTRQTESAVQKVVFTNVDCSLL